MWEVDRWEAEWKCYCSQYISSYMLFLFLNHMNILHSQILNKNEYLLAPVM